MTKIGIADFINTAPVLETWKRTVSQKKWELYESTPEVLGNKLAEGNLDLGLVPSYEYALHPGKYNILSGLSISISGTADSAGSVFLFSHVPLEQLDQSPVFLSSHSETSIALVKIILEEFNNIKPVYTIGDINSVKFEDYKGVLAIGDEALRLVAESTYLYQFDLGNIWKRQTGLPFVCDVFLVRDEFCSQYQDITDQVHKELLRCRDEGLASLKEVCTIAAGRIPMPESRCLEYLQTIEYDLDAQKQKGLVAFIDLLIKRGEADKNVLPLKIYSNLC